MYELQNPAQRYDWGSPTAIPALLGVPADGSPVAEVWMGAHPSAPSMAVLDDGSTVALDVLVAGADSGAGPDLPFLLKLLAAERPLSLQAHPDAAQARRGFAAEEEAGVPRDAATRTYRDPNPKPELLVALTPFEVLSGFRDPVVAAHVVRAFGLTAAADRLAAGDLAGVLWDWWGADAAGRAAVADAVVAGAARAAADFPDEAALVVRAAALHPGDVGVAVTLLLNRLVLAPGEALFAAAGRLHAYVAGFGVEIMANSDNVVRGGLTTKAVDVAELRRIVRVEPEPLVALRPVPVAGTPEVVFPSGPAPFRLGRATLDGGPWTPRRLGAEVVLCSDGALTLRAGDRTVHLRAGGSVFVPAGSPTYTVEGRGACFRASAHADDVPSL